jgi:hypothetical protein
MVGGSAPQRMSTPTFTLQSPLQHWLSASQVRLKSGRHAGVVVVVGVLGCSVVAVGAAVVVVVGAQTGPVSQMPPQQMAPGARASSQSKKHSPQW